MCLRKIFCALLFITIHLCIVLCTRNRSLTFIIDGANNFDNYIDQLKTNSDVIMDIIKEKTSPINDMVLVTFNDLDAEFKSKTSISNNPKKALESIYSDEFTNYNCDALSLTGSKIGLENSQPGSHIYVITDSTAKDYEKYDEILGLAHQTQSQVSFILLTGNCFGGYYTPQYQVYHDIATVTSGQVFRVDNITPVLPVLEETIRHEKELITSRIVISPDFYSDVPFTVDDQTEYFIVSVTGYYVSLNIIPSTPKEDIMWDDNVKVVKLTSLAPGDYVASVTSSTPISVMVFAKTDFLFEHGFSELEPKSFEDTSKQPISCTGGHLSILVTDPKKAVRIQTVQILDMDENIIEEQILRNVPGKFYKTKLVNALCGMFKIAVKGTVIKTGKPIRRLSKTPVSPQEVTWVTDISPATTISEGSQIEVPVDRTLILTCKVNAYPMPAIFWKDSKGNILDDESGPLQLPYGYISYLKVPNNKFSETYKCQADNYMGTSAAEIKVIVKSPIIPPSNVAPVIDKKTRVTQTKEGDSTTIECNILKGVPNPNMSWYFKSLGSSTYTNLDVSKQKISLSSARFDQSGHYKCKAENTAGNDEHVTELIINIPPKVTIAGGKKLNVPYGSSPSLTCIVKAFPVPTIAWIDDIGGQLRDAKIVAEKNGFEHKSMITLNHVAISQIFDCRATNPHGNDKASIEVLVMSPFTTIKSPPEITKVLSGDNVTLPCEITSHLPMKIKWFYVNDKTKVKSELNTSHRYFISTDGMKLTIKSADLDLAGTYTCKAALLEDENVNKVYNTHISVDTVKPKIQKGTHTIDIMEKETVSISCKILEGAPTPSIIWQFKGRESTSFQTIPGSEESKTLHHVTLAQSGFYKCKAENSVGQDQYITELIVGAPPTIVLDDKKTIIYEAIEGDIVLRIPCNATGYPKPMITWISGEKKIIPGVYMSIDDEALVLKSPKEKDSNNYTCLAENKYGSDNQTFLSRVTPFIENYGESYNIYILNGTSVKITCRLPHTKSDSIRWFLEGVELNNNESSYSLNIASFSNDGNYTCRVSNNLGSNTETYVVDVGIPPKFKMYPETTIDWRGDRSARLNCDVISKPEQNVQWTYNGIVIANFTDTQLPIINWGNYTCKVSNVHGSVERTYDVSSQVCRIDRTQKFPNMPLLLNENSDWLDLETVNEFFIIQPTDKIMLSCPTQSSDQHQYQDQSQYQDYSTNVFNLFPQENEIIATCDHKDNFIVDNKIYKVSDLNCALEVLPIVTRTGVQCLNENTEKLKVGFFTNTFVVVYEVCYNITNDLPIYVSYVMSSTNDMAEVSEYKWYTHSDIGTGRSDNIYNCQNDTLSCCYSKTQLVNVRDVSYGPAQASTFINQLNAIPYWHPCNKKSDSWGNIEDRIRSKLQIETKFKVWSGASMLNAHVGAIPRYLWKVVKFIDSSSIAIIHINDPSPTLKDVLCNNACTGNAVAWIEPLDENTYCCVLDDFLRVFGLPDTTFANPII